VSVSLLPSKMKLLRKRSSTQKKANRGWVERDASKN
jgi:hypothetical protein